VRRLGTACLLAALLLLPGTAYDQRRPNLLFLSIDTLRADHVSCYGYERKTTPSLDEMARSGLRFAKARSVAPWTLPSFASMLTGRYPTRHGAGAEGPLRDISHSVPRVLSSEVPTLGEVLKRSGYRTGAVTSNPYLRLGPLRGFDDAVCKAIRADRIGSLSREWIHREVDGAPWALWVHFNDPHEPTLAADPQLRALGYGEEVLDDPARADLVRWGSKEKGSWLGNRPSADGALDLLRTKVALYDATILQVDHEIGRILELLQRKGQLRNTVVVVVSDHGEEFLDHAEEGARWRHDPRGIWGIGHGHTLFEEQLHVPLILMGPGISPDRVIAEDFPLTELMPTLLGLLGLPAPAGMDGEDRGAWLRDRQRAPIPMAAESTAYGPDWMAWIDGRHKVVTDRTGHVQLLYDLREDPYELHDLSASIDSLAFAPALRESLSAWNERALADAPPPSEEGALTDDMRAGLKSLGYVQ